MATDQRKPSGNLSLAHFHSEVQVAVDLFEAGFLQEAVRKAAERFINRVAEKAEREDLVGQSLVNHVFSADSPVLVFTEERVSATDRNWHDGYRALASGLSTGVRNVYTHLDTLPVDEVEAWEWLGFISAMHRRLDRAFQYVPPPADPKEAADASDPEDVD
ncbi:MAG: hypothetical protein F4Z51_07885 [Chloroflexi bacterium]|nr:hypothetical protein [Chloroflexota bacterium]MYD17828.1 hypothetical protein [Chloroflexota bacterium]